MSENIIQANEIQDETEENVNAENDAGPSHAEAFPALETETVDLLGESQNNDFTLFVDDLLFLCNLMSKGRFIIRAIAV
ncbi:hypothetical protein K1T71_014572 [Dendrolimus kikuchii]|uniref:Uncharacterized protein n=1 Tax=Dendrolimus kikuchii TaxID=765133 RepID=A0ACC1CEF9_9NEOP|nr:hypothetical protein K1T71_014572 [Dendrolimus kikuchii]